MNFKKATHAVSHNVKEYLKEEYGVYNVFPSFYKDIYQQHRIYITVTFPKVCDELFAKGRNHQALIDYITEQFVQSFDSQWILERITLLKDETVDRIVSTKPLRIGERRDAPSVHISTLLLDTQKVTNR